MTEQQVKKVFADKLVVFRKYFPKQLVGVKLVVHDKQFTPGCNKFRDIAWADINLKTVNICRRVLNFSDNTIIGLLTHEISHLCDTAVESDNKEQRADDIAELVTGQRIKYSGPYMLQTIGEGVYPRPLGLHR